MELSGHECVGFCEWDKFATASYTSMHLITEEQREYLRTLTLKQRQKEILKEKYRNGEWYANDIRRVCAKDIPTADCWCFGAPCQDFSIAGKRAGLKGDSSSLVGKIFRLLEELEEKDRPEWLIYENVKGMLSSNRGLDYLSILSEMDRLGYDCEWQNMHSVWYVPQHRERIYTVGHLRRYGFRKIFPIKGADGENSVCQIGMRTAKRKNPNTNRVYDTDGITACLNTMEGGGREPSVGIKVIGTTNSQIHSVEDVHAEDGIMSRLTSRDYNSPKKIAIPVLTPDRAEKRQNGRRFKEDGEQMFTLTAQDRHGVGIGLKDICFDLKAFSSKTRGKAERIGHAATLDHNCNQGVIGGIYTNVSAEYQRGICEGLSRGLKANKHDCSVVLDVSGKTSKQGDGIYVELPQGFTVYAVWYEKYQCYITIRKLTPKECFRLQGWTDDYFEKAAFVNSNSQLYKQAGNGVTVPVVREIGKKIAEQTKGERRWTQKKR